MKLLKEKYIILELIPTSLDPDKGLIIQLSALKLNGLNLLERFDYRLKDELIPYKSIKEMFSYDKENFTYKNSSKEILDAFTKWSEDLPLLIIDNDYTEKYLSKISNKKESIFNYLNIKYTDDVIERLISKYELQPSNYIVDILYESLIKEL